MVLLRCCTESKTLGRVASSLRVRVEARAGPAFLALGRHFGPGPGRRHCVVPCPARRRRLRRRRRAGGGRLGLNSRHLCAHRRRRIVAVAVAPLGLRNEAASRKCEEGTVETTSRALVKSSATIA